MALRVRIYSPALTGGSLDVYRSGEPETRLYAGLPAITRGVDLYRSSDAVASAGRWSTTLDSPDGLFHPDGIFEPGYRATTCAVSLDDTLIFVGRPEAVAEARDGTGARVVVQWRDLVDDVMAQQIEGVDVRLDRALPADVRERAIGVARVPLREALGAFGIPAAAGTVTVDDLMLWFPRETTTLRAWLLPVLTSLGFSVDWQGEIEEDGRLAADLRLAHESRFSNAALPVLGDDDIVGAGVALDDGRTQIANLWAGRRRWWNPGGEDEAGNQIDAQFETEDLKAFGSRLYASVPAWSRRTFGERRARVRTEQWAEPAATIVRAMNATVRRRCIPHPRLTVSLRASECSRELRIGDGFALRLARGMGGARGLNRVCRVISRTVDLERETIRIYAEVRDGQDDDYRAWYEAGRVTRACTPPRLLFDCATFLAPRASGLLK